jgi:hypothetical protein
VLCLTLLCFVCFSLNKLPLEVARLTSSLLCYILATLMRTFIFKFDRHMTESLKEERCFVMKKYKKGLPIVQSSYRPGPVSQNSCSPVVHVEEPK